MRLLGDWNWYLPGFLGWLPHVTIEVEPTDDPGDRAAIDEPRRRMACRSVGSLRRAPTRNPDRIVPSHEPGGAFGPARLFRFRARCARSE